MGSNPLEQLKSLELKANFTQRERQYFYKLRDELEAIVGGVSIEELKKPTDVAQARRIRAKLEEILKFVQKREMEIEAEDLNRERFMGWIKESRLEDKLTDEWVNENIDFSPDRIVCKCDLDLSQTSIAYLPDNLTINGYLNLEGCTALIDLPENLTVCDVSHFVGCTLLTHLPNNFTAKESLVLEGCTALTQLSNDLKLGGSLILTDCTALVSLPDNLTVNGRLDLENCTSLGCLPENLMVQGALNLSGCVSLSFLSDDLQIAGDVGVYECPRAIIKRIKNLKKLGRIRGRIV